MAQQRGAGPAYSDSIRRHLQEWMAVGVYPWGGPRANMATKIATDEAARATREAAPAQGIGVKR